MVSDHHAGITTVVGVHNSWAEFYHCCGQVTAMFPTLSFLELYLSYSFCPCSSVVLYYIFGPEADNLYYSVYMFGP